MDDNSDNMAYNQAIESQNKDGGSSTYSREEEEESELEEERGLTCLSGSAWQEVIGAQRREITDASAPVAESELTAPLKAYVVAFIDVFNETSFSVFKFWQSMPTASFTFSRELRQAIFDVHELLHSSGEAIERQYQEDSRYIKSEFSVGDGKQSFTINSIASFADPASTDQAVNSVTYYIHTSAIASLLMKMLSSHAC